jgi:hypothetical protein
MLAVSMTPHAQYNFRPTSKSENHVQNGDAMQKKIKNACGVIDTAPHAKYDIACTIDERFERPWRPLKGISIKNKKNVPELSYPAPKKIYKFKAAT